MGLFDKFKKNKQEEVFKQDLSEKARPGMIFMMQLLFKEQCKAPEKEAMTAIMEKHLGEVENFSYDRGMAGFAAKKYTAHFKEGEMPPQLMITQCTGFDETKIGAIERSQMWNCEESERILSECKYQVVATDMLAATLTSKERAELDMDFMEALVEMFPDCEAVYFNNSGKLFTADAIRNHSIPRESRFIYFAVNARFFNIQGTDDMMVDTLGMSTLFLPDLQYHFHDMDPNWVVDHAYNFASYIFDNDNPMENGDTIDGIVDGSMNRQVQWRCQYEESLIQPSREVIDICMKEYASGTRE